MVFTGIVTRGAGVEFLTARRLDRQHVQLRMPVSAARLPVSLQFQSPDQWRTIWPLQLLYGLRSRYASRDARFHLRYTVVVNQRRNGTTPSRHWHVVSSRVAMLYSICPGRAGYSYGPLVHIVGLGLEVRKIETRYLGTPAGDHMILENNPRKTYTRS